jgi:hypothetical protein
MRLAAIALLLPIAAYAQDRAPPPPGPNDPGEVVTPGQAASQEMLVIYEEFCLERFPSAAALQAGIAAHHLSPASAADTTDALLGHPGTAWTIATAKGHYLLALDAPPRQGCAITGRGTDDEGIRAAFNLAVEIFAQGKEFGMLQRPPLQNGHVGGLPATVQIIGATPSSYPRQAFVNTAATNPDGGTTMRLSRVFAPK